MTPGPTLVLACPVCGALVRQRSLASGNTFGATLWSDGRFDAPMLPDATALTLCAGGHWFWLADAAEVGEHHWFYAEPDTVTPPEWEDAPFAEDLDADGYADALAAGLGSSPDREAHLRLRLWWASNDAHRGTGAAPAPDVDNLQRLQALQDTAPLNELELDDAEPEDDEEAGDDASAPTERGNAVLRAAVAHALGQTDRARGELSLANLPADWSDAFARLVVSGDRRITALSDRS